MYEFLNRIELVCWDNEGDAGDSGDAGNGGETQQQQQNTERTFTQVEVDQFVQKRNKALKAQFEQMEKNYETLLKQQNLTKEQRDKLENDLEAVRSEMMTKEQRLAAEQKKAEAKYQADLKAAAEEATKYKSLYEESTISRAIQDAAVKADGFSPGQFVAYLAPKTKMVEEVDSQGTVTGKLVPRVEWTAVDQETGATVVMLKTPEEAVELMKENVVDFGNMFKPNVAAGIGSGTAPGQVSAAGQIDHRRISTAEYMELAKTPEGRRKLGIGR